MNGKIFALALCVLLCAGVLVSRAALSAPEECFSNDGLKQSHTVKPKFDGKKVWGVYEIEDYDEHEAKTFVELKRTVARSFTGTRTRTKTGWLLKIYFAKGAPYQLPPKTKRIEWRIGKRDNHEVLIVPTYGKNYRTNKYTVYEMQLDAGTCVTKSTKLPTDSPPTRKEKTGAP